jgi:hypothetical protein
MIKDKICSIDGCNKKARSGKCKWCEMHYYRNRRNGDPEKLLKCQYRVNEKIFDEWSDSTAWMIGLLWTDGYTDGCNSIGIKLKDVQLIEEIHREMDTSVEIKTQINKHTGNEYKYISISNKCITDRLKEIGMHKNKTHTIEYPKGMPDKFFFSFLRGVIDGDGTIYLAKTRKNQKTKDCKLFFVTASEKFALRMCEELKSREIKFSVSIRSKYLKSGKLCKQWLGTDLWRIQVSKISDLRRLYKEMYPSDNVPCLHRKRDSLREFYETPRVKSGRPKVSS